jgi:hypothetical protein
VIRTLVPPAVGPELGLTADTDGGGNVADVDVVVVVAGCDGVVGGGDAVVAGGDGAVAGGDGAVVGVDVLGGGGSTHTLCTPSICVTSRLRTAI